MPLNLFPRAGKDLKLTNGNVSLARVVLNGWCWEDLLL